MSKKVFFPLSFQSEVWSDFGKNKESIGELWLGLLRFYTEEFDFKEHVICIRRKSLLTTFKKQWTSKYIVIEGISTSWTFYWHFNIQIFLLQGLYWMTNVYMHNSVWHWNEWYHYSALKKDIHLAFFCKALFLMSFIQVTADSLQKSCWIHCHCSACYIKQRAQRRNGL